MAGGGQQQRAVVLGASMAGLLTAAALSRSYASVTVVERDVLPQEPAHRRGVPQSHHTHALLARGIEILDELLPGLRAQLLDAGAHDGDLLGNVRWMVNGHRLSRRHIGQPLLFCGRELLEGLVRERVRQLRGVTFVDGTDVEGLVASADGRRVKGVRIGPARGAAGKAEAATSAAAASEAVTSEKTAATADTAAAKAGGGPKRKPKRAQSESAASAESASGVITADLVVDTTGRGSRTPRWLRELGYAPPPVERMTVDVAYATRPYRLPEGFLGADRLVLNGWTPDSPRAGTVVSVEGGRHLVTLAGLLGDRPPTDPKEFEEFAGTLDFPDIGDAVRAGEPLGDPVAFRYPSNLRHRYELLGDFPEGLLVLGDAFCAFNPLYGQGMTSAALQARALAQTLAGDREPDWRAYFKAAAAAVDDPWEITTFSDLVFPGVQGHRTPRVRFTNAYLARLHAAAASDPALSEAFVHVTGLVAAPRSLLRPDLAARVLLRGGPLLPVPPGRRG